MLDPLVHPAVLRVVDAAARKGVTLAVTTFEESTHTAAEAAAALGVGLGQIVKSLVFVDDGDEGPEAIIALVSGPNRVDVARLAAVTGAADVRRATAREANALTGFVIGGIPPIGFARPVRVVMDPDLGRYPVVWAAAGIPTAVFPVPPGTLRILANATVAPITEEPALPPAMAPQGTSADGATPSNAQAASNADSSSSTATAPGAPAEPEAAPGP